MQGPSQDHGAEGYSIPPELAAPSPRGAMFSEQHHPTNFVNYTAPLASYGDTDASVRNNNLSTIENQPFMPSSGHYHPGGALSSETPPVNTFLEQSLPPNFSPMPRYQEEFSLPGVHPALLSTNDSAGNSISMSVVSQPGGKFDPAHRHDGGGENGNFFSTQMPSQQEFSQPGFNPAPFSAYDSAGYPVPMPMHSQLGGEPGLVDRHGGGGGYTPNMSGLQPFEGHINNNYTSSQGSETGSARGDGPDTLRTQGQPPTIQRHPDTDQIGALPVLSHPSSGPPFGHMSNAQQQEYQQQPQMFPGNSRGSGSSRYVVQPSLYADERANFDQQIMRYAEAGNAVPTSRYVVQGPVESQSGAEAVPGFASGQREPGATDNPATCTHDQVSAPPVSVGPPPAAKSTFMTKNLTTGSEHGDSTLHGSALGSQLGDSAYSINRVISVVGYAKCVFFPVAVNAAEEYAKLLSGTLEAKASSGWGKRQFRAWLKEQKEASISRVSGDKFAAHKTCPCCFEGDIFDPRAAVNFIGGCDDLLAYIQEKQEAIVDDGEVEEADREHGAEGDCVVM